MARPASFKPAQFLERYCSILAGVTSSNGTQTIDSTLSPLASFSAVSTAP